MNNEKRIAGWSGKPLEKMMLQTRTILERLPTQMITQEHFEDIKTDVYYIVKDMPGYLDTIEAQAAELADMRGALRIMMIGTIKDEVGWHASYCSCAPENPSRFPVSIGDYTFQAWVNDWTWGPEGDEKHQVGCVLALPLPPNPESQPRIVGVDLSMGEDITSYSCTGCGEAFAEKPESHACPESD